MPTAEVNGITYNYVDEGSGPLIVFGHGLLASREMFRAQIDALSDRYRCVSLDWPGHGESGYREEGWTFWDLADDAATLVRQELGGEPAVFVGLSQGGFAFIRLALSHPNLVRGLVLMDTSAGPEEAERLEGYRELADAFLNGDDEQRRQIAEVITLLFYGEPFRNARPDAVEHEIGVTLGHDRKGQYIAEHAVFDRDDVSDRVTDITAPTLVIHGELDASIPVERGRFLAESIPGAELVTIPDAGHHSAIETPDAVNEALERFLQRL